MNESGPYSEGIMHEWKYLLTTDTPGRVVPVEEPDTTICAFGFNDAGTDERHARLIAAAPDLLAACEAMLSSPSYGDTPSPEALELCRNAIAKASF